MRIEWKSPGREELSVELSIEGGNITKCEMSAIGSLSFLRYSQKMKPLLAGAVTELRSPDGSHYEAMIWREVFDRIKTNGKVRSSRKNFAIVEKS